MSSKNVEVLAPQLVTTSPQRPRRQVKRSITEMSPPSKLSRHHHLHHLHHRKDRDRDERGLLSGSSLLPLPLPRGSLDRPKSEGVTPNVITETSSKPNTYWLSVNNGADVSGPTKSALASPGDKDDDLMEHKDLVASIRGLRKSLVDLGSSSNATMRRLDDTYYSVLERLGMLQSTIVAVKELAGMAQDVDEGFRSESQGLVDEIETQVASLDQFDDQQQRIQDLQGRIYAGRRKAEALSTRVDVVRGRIEGWERADTDWQERTRKRLKVLWTITLVLVLATVLLFIGAQYAPSSMTELTPGHHIGAGRRNSLDDLGRKPDDIKNADALVDEVRKTFLQRRDKNSSDDAPLRLFDEL